MIVRSELKGKHWRLYKKGQAKLTEVLGFRISGGTTHGDDNNLEHRWTHGRAKHI